MNKILNRLLSEKFKKIIIVLAGLVSASLIAVPVLALAAQSTQHVPSSVINKNTNSKNNAGQNAKNTAKNTNHQATTALSGARLKACENKQSAINNILSRIVTRGENQLNLFTTIAQRVENFATTKNAKPSSYDQLVAELQISQFNVTNDLNTMKANDTFSCQNQDPKGMVTYFQTQLKQEISDLQSYKTNVKNLIVAVKTDLGTTTSSKTQTTTLTSTGGSN